MKTAQHFVKAISIFLIVVATPVYKVYAQDSEKEKKAAVRKMVDAKDYVFVAQSVLPLRGKTRQLTSVYDLKVSADTLICDLPFFGKAYTAPVNPSEGGINFTSTGFEYTAGPRTKGGWDILIKPKDVTGIQQLLLTIYDNGTAFLRVNSSSRDPISFNGYITGREQK